MAAVAVSEPKFILGERYEVMGLLGGGGMGEVHRGRDLRLGREVAAKLLKSDLARDPSFHVRFRREAQAAASLNHPAIIAVYDVGEDRTSAGAIPYIIMEYIGGANLRDILKQSGQLTFRESLTFAADICGALDYSHRNGIVHRDIKPSNISHSAAARASPRAVLGTLPYMSPEQMQGDEVDGRTDVYAIGCVLYEMVTGVPPVSGNDPVELLYQHTRGRIRSPSSLRSDMPPGMNDVILTALQKNPLDRYQSASEFRASVVQELSNIPEPLAARERHSKSPANDGVTHTPEGGREGGRLQTALDRLRRSSRQNLKKRKTGCGK